MAYESFKRTLLRLLRAPAEPPEPPAGSHASVRVFRASPRYLTYRLLGVLVLAAVLSLAWIGIGVAFAVSGEPLGLLLLLPLGLLFLTVTALHYVHVRIDYDLRYYVVTDRSIRIREGAFVVKEKTLTYANVQNLRVVQGPLMRFFGIKSLAVDTAGGGAAAASDGHAPGGHRFELAGIENAGEVRDLVLSHLRRRGAGSGLGDPDDEHEPRGAGRLGPGARAALEEVLGAARALRAAAEGRAAGARPDGIP